ncbi:serine/arginine repetitive matrix protein 4-like [Nasonia vitripennis]|uniref:Serine/arginine repetitive matrix protein C-terminal domain-containing protein n=1 Tax=Nasonia vitripennis TaxID=7425 RepID=A0A7M7R3P5_NASVI|nr:serine/arginine repetitive matrix protein 4-like [Nasonia vitripennis]
MENRYQGRWNVNMMADFCWTLKRDIKTNNKKRKRNPLHSSARYSRINYSSESTSSVTGRNSRPASSELSRSRSPSIPRRYGSPSFLDRRRITSARKRPVPYHRPTPSPVSSQSSMKSSTDSSCSTNSVSSCQTKSCGSLHLFS